MSYFIVVKSGSGAGKLCVVIGSDWYREDGL